jgi:hypothetical protein
MTPNRTAKIGRSYSVKKPEGNYTVIIDQIVDEVVNRTRQDIQTWRTALDAADDPDHPQWHLLQDLYEYLSTDAHLRSQIGIRKGAVLGKRFFVRDSSTGKENKDKTKLLQKKWFFNLVSDLMDSKFRGYTLLQLPDKNRVLKPNPLVSAYDLLPRKQFIPQWNLVLTQAGGTTAYDITDPAFNNTIICIKDQDKFGLMNYVVPDLIWKKNARQGWAILSERFGIPLVKIQTDKRDPKEIDKLELMAKKMGQAARAILPTGSQMEVINIAGKGDPHKIYLEQSKHSNDEISKAILGGTMISDNGSSRSQGEVHERVLDDKVTAMDLIDMEFTITDQLFPILRSFGLPFGEGDEFVYDRSQTLTLDAHWKIVKDVLNHYEVDEQWLAETFNLNLKGKKVATAPTVPPADPEEDPENKPEPAPKDKKPKAKGFFG